VLRESYLKPMLCSVLLLVSILAIHPASNLSWSGMIEMCLVFGLLYCAIILQSGFFDEYDWNKLERFIPTARHARRLCRIA
jgi:hypothetical protein